MLIWKTQIHLVEDVHGEPHSELVDPILAVSEDWEAKAKRENQQIDLALVAVCVTGALLAVSGLLWLGSYIGTLIDHLGRMPQ